MEIFLSAKKPFLTILFVWLVGLLYLFWYFKLSFCFTVLKYWMLCFCDFVTHQVALFPQALPLKCFCSDIETPNNWANLQISRTQALLCWKNGWLEESSVSVDRDWVGCTSRKINPYINSLSYANINSNWKCTYNLKWHKYAYAVLK